MYIKYLNIENFGKLNSKKLTLQKGINVIYGENESGKSTIYHYIQSMLIGIDKKRGRQSVKDEYNQYKSWNMYTTYGGMMIIEVDGKEYRITRNFDKNNEYYEVVDIHIGKQLDMAGLEPITLINGMTKNMYKNIMSINQENEFKNQEIEIELNEYLLNMRNIGNMKINISNAIHNLEKQKKYINKRLDEKEIIRLKAKIEECEDVCHVDNLYVQLQNKEQELAYLQEIATDASEYSEKVEIQIHTSYRNIILGLLFIIIGVSLWFIPFHEIYNKIVTIICIIIGVLCIYFSRKAYEVTYDDEIDEENSYKSIHNMEITNENHHHNKQVKNIQKEIDKLNWQIEECEIKEIKKQSYIEQLNTYSDKLRNREFELNAIKLAKDTINELTQESRIDVEEELNDIISTIISDITDKKYHDIKVNEGMEIKIDDGEQLIPLSRLSNGTQNQIQFAIRQSILEVIYGNYPIPIIIDEGFNQYDDKRLFNVLSWLAEQNNRQIIIFTCTSREIDTLDKLEVPYTYIYI